MPSSLLRAHTPGLPHLVPQAPGWKFLQVKTRENRSDKTAQGTLGTCAPLHLHNCEPLKGKMFYCGHGTQFPATQAPRRALGPPPHPSKGHHTLRSAHKHTHAAVIRPHRQTRMNTEPRQTPICALPPPGRTCNLLGPGNAFSHWFRKEKTNASRKTSV